MSLKRFKQFKTLSGIFLLVFVMLLLKMGLTIGHLFTQPSETKLPPFPSEVMAEERKTKAQEAADQKKKKQQPSAQTSDSTPKQDSPQTPAPGQVNTSDMIAHLEQRETELKKKEEQLRQKEEYLTQMEQGIEKKLKELSVIQKEIQAYRAEKEESQSSKIRSLSKIYGSMKPKEAAKLIENLEDRLVVNIIGTLSSDEAANIMSNMDVKKAAKIAESLSHR